MLAESLAMAAVAMAHDFYERECCSGHDCEPVPATALVEEVRGGWRVVFESRDLGPIDLFFPAKLKRDSLDGRFHACIRRSDRQPLCLYVPVNT